jgi:hypothetical protein
MRKEQMKKMPIFKTEEDRLEHIDSVVRRFVREGLCEVAGIRNGKIVYRFTEKGCAASLTADFPRFPTKRCVRKAKLHA